MKRIILSAAVACLFLACNKKTTQTSTTPVNQNSARQGSGSQRQGGGRPSTDEIFSKMDSNKDGKISKSEAKGPLSEDFNTIDSNNDGFLSKAEVENAPKPQGKPGGKGR